jgi:hypothetical protein
VPIIHSSKLDPLISSHTLGHMAIFNDKDPIYVDLKMKKKVLFLYTHAKLRRECNEIFAKLRLHIMACRTVARQRPWKTITE